MSAARPAAMTAPCRAISPGTAVSHSISPVRQRVLLRRFYFLATEQELPDGFELLRRVALIDVADGALAVGVGERRHFRVGVELDGVEHPAVVIVLAEPLGDV